VERLRKIEGASLFGDNILAVVTAIFAYFIAPDDSPYANRIILKSW